MQNIAELERRITAALERIGMGLDRVASRPPPAPPAPAAPTTGAEALLRAELDEERSLTAQLKERIAALNERATKAAERAAEVKPVHVPVAQAQLEARIDKMTRQLDVQGLELQRMRKITIQLRDQLARLREAAQAGVTEPHLINKTMLTELEALRAARQGEIAEMDEILAELTPLIAEVQAHA
jgi:predicted  nucleic acid-binding Zn-ribbon protein